MGIGSEGYMIFHAVRLISFFSTVIAVSAVQSNGLSTETSAVKSTSAATTDAGIATSINSSAAVSMFFVIIEL